VRAGEKLAATNPFEHRILAAALFRAGQFEAALAAYDKFPKNFARGAWDSFFLTMIHEKLGKHDEAIVWHANGVEWAKRFEQPASRNHWRNQWWEVAECEALRAESARLLGLGTQPPPLATEPNT
jgi:hypothetical protein